MRNKRNIFLIFVMSVGMSVPAFGQATVEPAQTTPVQVEPELDRKPQDIDTSKTDQLLDSLSNTLRDTKQDKEGSSKKILLSVFDIRLPLVFDSCDVKINFGVLSLSFAVSTDKPGAENELRRFADAIYRKSDDEFRGVSKKCSTALRGFSVSILKVYLGSDWNAGDESSLKRSMKNSNENKD